MNVARILIVGARIFDGSNPELIDGGSVLVEDGIIREVSDRTSKASADTVVEAGGRTLMPGLIDLHTHFHITDVNTARGRRRSTEYISCWLISQLEKTLDRGFTTIRDAGGTHPSYARAIDQGLIRGPRYFPSGRVMSQTGGHGDNRAPDDESSWDICPMCHGSQSRFAAIVDSPDEMRKAVREELRKGATQIKIHASGGVSSASDPLELLQFSDAEIRTAVEEASRRGTYVLAHCHPTLSVRRCVELGVRCIEHASFIDDETAQYVADSGAYVVPTLAVAKALQDDGRKLGFPEASLMKLGGVLDAMRVGIERMQRAGVKMGLGTDLLGPHQERQSMEFQLRAEVQPVIDVLRSATSIAAEILCMPAKLGCISQGALADMILIDGDPTRDIGLLARGPAVMPMIMTRGRLHRYSL